jgi:hypothetical protein
MFSESIDDIIAAIEAAFDGVPRGRGVTLHEAEVIDAYGSDAQRRKARKHDSERRWQDVPDEQIEEHYSILCFLDAEGFRYYIPAYMIWSLRNYRTSQSASSDWTIYAFSHNAAKQDARVSLLNLHQRGAICRFLRYFAESDEEMADSYMAELALLRFGWDQYCVECETERE